MNVISSNLQFNGLKISPVLDTYTFKSLKDDELITTEEKFGRAFSSLRDIAKNLGFSEKIVETSNNGYKSFNIVFKKAKAVTDPKEKLDSKVFEIKFNNNLKEKRIIVRYGSKKGDISYENLKKDFEQTKDFTLKELKDLFATFYNTYESTVLEWEENLSTEEFNSIKSGPLPQNLTSKILGNVSTNHLDFSSSFIQANPALFEVQKTNGHLEIKLKNPTPQELFKLALAEKEKKATKKEDSDSSSSTIKEKEEEKIKIPDVIPIIYRDVSKGEREFFLPSVLSSYQDDLNIFFDNLNSGIRATFNYSDGKASIILHRTSDEKNISTNPQIVLEVSQNTVWDGNITSKTKVLSKNMDETDQTPGNNLDKDKIHLIEERSRPGVLAVSQIDFFVFNVAQIFADAIKNKIDSNELVATS